MQIYCPKCHTGYQINDHLVEDKSRRLKCSACGEIFDVGHAGEKLQEEIAEDTPENVFAALSEAMAEEKPQVEEARISAEEEITEEIAVTSEVDEVAETPQEDSIQSEVYEKPQEEVTEESAAEEEEPADTPQEEDEETDNINLEQIFERLSEHTEHLIEREKTLPIYEKAWLQIKNVLGFHFKIKWSYIFITFGVFVVLSLYNNRYQVVRDVPFLNGVYKAFGIKAKIPGEGLEFQNINWEFISDDEGPRLEIKGFINNQTDKNIDLPTVHIEILDKDTALLQSQNREVEAELVEAHTRLPLTLVVKSPAPTAKYVYLTFIDKD